MPRPLLAALVAAAALAFASAPAHAIKKVPYPEVKVRPPAAFKGDAAFGAMRKALADAAAKKNLAALSALVAANFAWTAGGEPNEQADKGRDGLHNFKVALGFRQPGQTVDNAAAGGWDLLAEIAAATDFAQAPSAPNTACAPSAAVPDQKAFEQASQRIEEREQATEWVYALGELTLTATRAGGAPVGKVTGVALPVASIFPAPRPNQQQPTPPTHLELLLPSGKTGWVPVNAVRSLIADQLCFTKQANGEWKISGYDQSE